MEQLNFVTNVHIRAIVTPKYVDDMTAALANAVLTLEAQNKQLVALKGQLTLSPTATDQQCEQVAHNLKEVNERRRHLTQQQEILKELQMGEEVSLGVQEAVIPVSLGDDAEALLKRTVAVLNDGTLVEIRQEEIPALSQVGSDDE